jgi:hypothetical protein
VNEEDDSKYRPLTIPEGFDEKPTDDNSKQMLIRVHKHEHTMLKVLLKKDKLTYQRFAVYCVQAYLDGDPHFLKMLRTYRELDTVPQDVRDKHVLSQRERSAIFDELEREEK